MQRDTEERKCRKATEEAIGLKSQCRALSEQLKDKEKGKTAGGEVPKDEKTELLVSAESQTAL